MFQPDHVPIYPWFIHEKKTIDSPEIHSFCPVWNLRLLTFSWPVDSVRKFIGKGPGLAFGKSFAEDEQMDFFTAAGGGGRLAPLENKLCSVFLGELW